MDMYPQCPEHNQSTYIQLDAQSHIMACETKRMESYGMNYLIPDYDKCEWVSDEFRQVGGLVWRQPFGNNK